MRVVWLLLAGCGVGPAATAPGVQLAMGDPVTAIAADEDLVAWTTRLEGADPVIGVWRAESSHPSVQVLAGHASTDGVPGRLVVANHQPYWEQHRQSGGSQIFTAEKDTAHATQLGGPMVSLFGADGPYLARLRQANDLYIADPSTGSDRNLWEGFYPIAGEVAAIGAGKLVLATPGRAQVVTLGNGNVVTIDLDGHVPDTVIPTGDGFFFVDAAGALFRVTADGRATHLADLQIDPARTFAAIDDDLWFTVDGGDGFEPVSVLVRVHRDGSREEQPLLANGLKVASAGETLVVVTTTGDSSTVWRVAP